MEKVKDSQPKVIGAPDYINENCWLAKTLNYSPAKRCRYCELKFHRCLFLQYLVISLVLTLLLFTLSFLIEGGIPKLVIISIFALVIVYGYFFNKSTEKVIEAYFAQRKAKKALEELAKGLESQVEQRTEELRKAYENLKVLDRTKSEFLSITSHQLRTPLSVIKGYISMIIESTYGQVPEKMKIPLKNIYNSNERLIKLINTLLDISRIESGKTKTEVERASLEEVIMSVVEELKMEAQKKKLYLKWEKPKAPLPKILIDRAKIRDAILNIIDNAIKYTNQGGVTIETKAQGSKYQVRISDTGRGMEKGEIAQLFESFSRGTAGKKFSADGVGLGLYVAKKFVDMHHGRIWVESPGKSKGSTFYIELPVKQPKI